MEAVRTENLGFRYKNRATNALNGVDLSVEQGECVVIAGQTGAGKSTLCLTMNGLVPRFLKGELSGRVLVFGEEVGEVSSMARSVGIVFQDFESQLFSTSVNLEVAFFPENLGLERKEIEERVRSSLSLVGLQSAERRRPASLSGGEKQRLAIASVLSGSPSVLIMDEPTSDLDPLGKSQLFEIIGALTQNRQTLVVVEHELEHALGANRIVLMRAGKVIAEGEPGLLLREPGLLEANGVRPIPLSQIFQGEKEAPITCDEGLRIATRREIRVQEAEYEKMLGVDRARKSGYGEVIVEVEGLRHIYQEGIEALSGVDLRVRRGEFIAICGQNGSGKTSLVKHLNGLLLPTEGEVRVKERPTKRWRKSELSRIVGYVFQNPDQQIFSDSVGEEVAFGPKNFGLSSGELKTRVAEALKAVDLEGCENEDPFSLTRGERQRVAVASALAARPEVLILDEPTTGLDYHQTRSAMELVVRLNREGYTIIFVTHSMWVIAEYAHRVVVMKEGRIILDGETRDIFSKEDQLLAAHLTPPQQVRFSNMLGKTLLSVQELKQALGQ